jgi:hypothetical protein
LGLLVGVVAYSAYAGDRLPELVFGIGAAGTAIAAVALVGRWPSLLPWGLAGVGAGYALYLSLRSGTVDSRAPLLAAMLFVAAELGYWSLERRSTRAERAVFVRRLVLLGLAGLAAALVASLLLVAASETSGGMTLEALGVAAAVVTLAVVVLLAARSGSEWR